MSSVVQPTPVTVGEAQWPVLFTFRAWWHLFQLYDDIEGVLATAGKADQAMAADFFMAGLLHDNPGLTKEAVAAILDEGTWAELEALPLALLQAVQAAQPDAAGEGDGDPWDWDVAQAVWATEWHQDPEAFWTLTFRDFASLSNGRAKLYAAAQKDRPQASSGDGWTIDELMQMNRRGR